MFNIHLKTALGYIRRSPFQAMAATFVLTLTFFVATLVAVLVYSSAKLINYFDTRLQAISLYVRIGGGVFAGMLALTSFVVLLIIITMRMSTRKEEVEILDLIGATQNFIRSPIIIEALLYSLFGVLLGWLIAFISILYLAPSAVTYFGEIPVLPRDTISLFGLFGIIFGIELIVSVVLALGGSLLAVSRVKKAK